ncbi:MAG: BMP family ABC transporter substrate-binding protein [Rhodobacteraceae bacterium]|nr:BMP family ABC transporter substrate-binding protein [Paracoccaceae bacterium]
MAGGMLAVPAISGAGQPLKVGAVYTVPVAQQWIARIHSALLDYVVRGEIDYRFSENVQFADYGSVLRQFASAGYDLVLSDAFAHEEDARLIAREFPNSTFLLGSGYAVDSRFPNVLVFDSYIQDASHLTGIVGGAMTQTGKVGIVARLDFPGVNRLLNAFIDGAREWRSNTEFVVDYIGSWYDPERAGELAVTQIAGGADVILADAAGAAETAGHNQIPAIGSFSGPVSAQSAMLVTAAVWHFEPTLQAVLDRVRGKSRGVNDFGIYSYIRHSGCSIMPIAAFPDRIPENAIERVARRENEMRQQLFTANHNPSRPFSGLFPALQ